MTDEVGMLQHANRSVPNPAFGYCTDDNARALMVASLALDQSPSDRRIEPLFGCYFRFVEAAFVVETGTFRNLLGYDRKWAAEAGPGDAAGRALWALGTVVGGIANGPRRMAARTMFERALPAAEAWLDLRPISNAILGAAAFLRREQAPDVRLTLESLADGLRGRLDESRSPDWEWPEPMMTYENARIPHALIEAGETLEDARLIASGLRSLEWLMQVQTVGGQFSPVGNHGWYTRGGVAARFDQQPIEAESSVSACAAAFRVTRDLQWLRHAQRSFDWFLGANASGQSLADTETGGCCDGLSERGVNENQGAESTLAWLSSLLSMARLTPSLPQMAGEPS